MPMVILEWEFLWFIDNISLTAILICCTKEKFDRILTKQVKQELIKDMLALVLKREEPSERVELKSETWFYSISGKWKREWYYNIFKAVLWVTNFLGGEIYIYFEDNVFINKMSAY